MRYQAYNFIKKGRFFDFDDTQIISNEHDYKKELLLETCHIAGADDPVNFRRDIENLSKTYNPIQKKGIKKFDLRLVTLLLGPLKVQCKRKGK